MLFVCLGNICRSPTAEAVFSSVVEREGLAGGLLVDSCGTGGGSSDWYRPGGSSYHEGDEADGRMAAAAAGRGVRLTSRSRPLAPVDIDTFGHIVCMDPDNSAAVLRACKAWDAEGRGTGDLTARAEPKIKMMADFLSEAGDFSGYTAVPDPYFGGPQGFETVLDLLDDASAGLLAAILREEAAAGEGEGEGAPPGGG